MQGQMKKLDDQINGLIGKNSELEGKLSFTGTVRIDGRFLGEITSGDTVIVGETGVLESDVHVSNIVIKGEVRGNVVAKQRIELQAPAKVFGNIQAPTITMEQGVILEGTCRMQNTHSPLLKQKIMST
ncbi:MAG: polymer-forming cytoskeletal protein [Deltaproteobacteria bacterium]|nr:polymer-forming cytoskeletal protein [Deltaproteobacteria bacterium]